MAQKWIPLESNPEIFNQWAKEAGLVGDNVVFQDVYGLDEGLLNMVGTPVKAVILLFPEGEDVLKKRREEDAAIAKAGPQVYLDPTIFWIKQTISNACGTMALIHALINTDVTLSPFKPLVKFRELCEGKSPEERAKILETTDLFTKIHDKFAHGGQTSVPTNLDTDLHFVCFVQAVDARIREAVANLDEEAIQLEMEKEENNIVTGLRLIELDGTRNGPVDRGESKDLLRDVAKLVRETYLTDDPANIKFNMIALGGKPPLSD